MDTPSARTWWLLTEPVHAVTYFSQESLDAATGLGYRGFWTGYMAFRASPLGQVPAAVVAAAFHGFALRRVGAALPQAWSIADPDQALAARGQSAARALRMGWSPTLPPAEIDEVSSSIANTLWRVLDRLDCAGRILAAANLALPRPDDPVEALWQACTTLREHRGDGHVAALVSAGISPVMAHHLKIAEGNTDAEGLRLGRGWSDEAWAAGHDRLVERGWLDGSGALTRAGRDAVDRVEVATDSAAGVAWAVLNPLEQTLAASALRPLATALVDRVVPARNPVGAPLGTLLVPESGGSS